MGDRWRLDSDETWAKHLDYRSICLNVTVTLTPPYIIGKAFLSPCPCSPAVDTARSAETVPARTIYFAIRSSLLTVNPHNLYDPTQWSNLF